MNPRYIGEALLAALYWAAVLSFAFFLAVVFFRPTGPYASLAVIFGSVVAGAFAQTWWLHREKPEEEDGWGEVCAPEGANPNVVTLRGPAR